MTVKEWIVPLEMTVRTECIVEAESAAEALAKANRGDWVEDFRAQGEKTDWEATGVAMPNE